MAYYMGIDLGTSSVKTLIMDGEGNTVSEAQEGYDILKPELDRAEQDPELLWEAAAKTIAEALKKAPGAAEKIRGIGYSGQMHGLVLTDGAGKPVRNAIIWADQRSEKEIAEIYSLVPADSYRSVTLNSLSTGFLAASLFWVKEHEPELFAKARHLLLPKDYIRFRMTGNFATEASDASSTCIFDTGKRTWAFELADRLGFPRGLFPACGEATDRAGSVTRECAEKTGLKEGTLVVMGAGDSLAASVGSGMFLPGNISANIGTACQLACTAGEPLHDPAFRTNTFCHVRKDRWMLMGAHLSGGVSLKWLKNNILHAESYDALTAEAGRVPAGSEGLFFLPYLSGERTPYNDPNAKGIWLGLTLRHTDAHLVRSVMEGIVFGMRNSFEIFKELGIRSSRFIASGGGARSPLFLKLEADIFNREVCTSSIGEQGCVGAALTAAVGAGDFSSLEEAMEKVVKFNPEVTKPDPENVKRYEEAYGRFREIYPANRGLFRK